jgi:hypothetical protein
MHRILERRARRASRFATALISIAALLGGATVSAATSDSVAINTSNSAPTIWGAPAATAYTGSTYRFQPGAADANGNKLTFSIVNKPAWMWFDTATGRLSGNPKWAQLNRTFSGITIRVSDGMATASLPPFSLTVRAPATANRAPTLSGVPVTVALVGQPYAFKPTAHDADNHPITFSISGKPAWASFDASNGTLYGTPEPGSAGVYSNIVIKGTDGIATTSLAPFSITVSTASTQGVTLNWTAPTTNTDGSGMTDLAGYVISYGTGPRQYSTSIEVWGAGASSAVVQGLSTGKTWYFAIRSFNTASVHSDLSDEVQATL